jgi:hypothetical protein
VAYYIVVGDRVLPSPFEGIADAYRYVLSSVDWDQHALPERWTLVERREGRDEVVVPMGKLLVEARRWREQRSG